VKEEKGMISLKVWSKAQENILNKFMVSRIDNFMSKSDSLKDTFYLWQRI